MHSFCHQLGMFTIAVACATQYYFPFIIDFKMTSFFSAWKCATKCKTKHCLILLMTLAELCHCKRWHHIYIFRGQLTHWSFFFICFYMCTSHICITISLKLIFQVACFTLTYTRCPLSDIRHQQFVYYFQLLTFQ